MRSSYIHAKLQNSVLQLLFTLPELRQQYLDHYDALVKQVSLPSSGHTPPCLYPDPPYFTHSVLLLTQQLMS